jgi:hypothetical protein
VSDDVYCIDTSALIDVSRHYPTSSFGVWSALAELVGAGRLFAPIQVLNEIEEQDDELTVWGRQHRAMFRGISVEVANTVLKIQNEIGPLGDLTKLPEPADPWVVAWTILENGQLGSELFPRRCVTVAHEGRRKPGGRHKIPDACEHFHVACVRILDLFAAEGWRFELAVPGPEDYRSLA